MRFRNRLIKVTGAHLLLSLCLMVSGLSAQTVSETRMLADFADGKCGIFDSKGIIAPSKELGGNSLQLKQGAGLSAWQPKVAIGSYDLLRMDIFNPGSQPAAISLIFRDDSAPHGYFSWITRILAARPGKSTLELYIPGLKRGEGSLKDGVDPRPFHWDKIQSISLDATTDVQIANIRVEKLDFPLDASVRAFAFGPVGAPVVLGARGVTPQTKYTDETGFGWTNASFSRSERRARPADTLLGSWIGCLNATFAVKVPDGTYHVLLMWEDPGLWDFYQNYTRRTVSQNGRMLLEETMNGKEFLDRFFHFAETEDLPGDDIYARYVQWRFKPRTFDVQVTGGRLDLTFNSPDTYGATINGLVIYPADKSEIGAKFLAALDAWRKHEFQMAWTERVPDRTTIAPDLAQKHASRGFVLFSHPRNEEVGFYQAPQAQEVLSDSATLATTMTQGELDATRFSVHALADLPEVKVDAGAFTNEKNQALPADAVSLQLVRQKFKCFGLANGLYGSVPWMLVDARPCAVSRGATRSCYLTARIPPGQAAGNYKGRVTVRAGGKEQSIAVAVKVLPLSLPQPDMGLGMFGIGGTVPTFAFFPENEARNKQDRQRSRAFAREQGLNYISVDGPTFVGFQGGKAVFDFTAVKVAYDDAKRDGFAIIDVDGGPANAMARSVLSDQGELAKKNGFASPEAMAKAFMTGAAEQARAAGVAVPAWSFWDEPPESAADEVLALHIRCAEAGGRCTIAWSPSGPKTTRLIDVTAIANLNVVKKEHIDQARKAGNTVYLNNQGTNRWAFGLYAWKAHQAGVAAFTQFVWDYYHVDPYYDLDGGEADLAAAYPDHEGNFRAVEYLTRIRQGITDYRYTLALSNAIGASAKGVNVAQKQVASEAQSYLDTIRSKVRFEDTAKDREPQMTEAQLDQYRAKVQDYLLKLQ